MQVEAASDESLIQTAQGKLPAADERRLKRLVGKSEEGRLTPLEQDDFVQLARRAEQLAPGGCKPCGALAAAACRRSHETDRLEQTEMQPAHKNAGGF